MKTSMKVLLFIGLIGLVSFLFGMITAEISDINPVFFNLLSGAGFIIFDFILLLIFVVAIKRVIKKSPKKNALYYFAVIIAFPLIFSFLGVTLFGIIFSLEYFYYGWTTMMTELLPVIMAVAFSPAAGLIFCFTFLIMTGILIFRKTPKIPPAGLAG
jgi:hypothetical protein